MKAVVCTEFGESEVRNVPQPDPDPGELLIAVDRVQLSVTECKLFQGHEIAHYESVRDRIRSGDGRVFGHEFCGRVVELGEGVTAFETGDRVYAPGKIPCFDCPHCDRGYAHLCSEKASIGYDLPGALAKFVSLPTAPLAKLPESVSDEEGAAMQPLASALLCTIDAGIEPGDTVVVVGTGVMGYQCAQLAKRFGAGDVYAVDVRSEPLEHAASRGMIPIDAREVDAAERIVDATEGIGADVVVEAVGGEQESATSGDGPLAQSFRTVRRGGTVLQVGHIIGDLEMRPRTLRSNYVNWVNPRKGVVSTGPNTTTGELAPTLVADGSVSITEFITDEVTGLKSFERVVEMTLDKETHGTLGPVQIVIE